MKSVLILILSATVIHGNIVKRQLNSTVHSRNVEMSDIKISVSDSLKMSEVITNETQNQQLLYNRNPIETEEPVIYGDHFYYQMRLDEISALKNGTKEDHPYPQKFNVTISLEDFVHSYINLNKGELLENITLSIAGRIHSVGKYGPEMFYYDFKTTSGIIQVIITSTIYNSHRFRIGDIIGCVGHPGKSRRGELTLIPSYIKLLAPCLHKIPTIFESDTMEQYVNLIKHEKTKQIFRTRARIIAYIRQFLDNMDFLEVETPILNKIPGGATAHPFKTHNDDLNMDYFLRIAPELYLKMLLIGGFDRVFEIGRQFRNEKIDSTHSPEFTSCETYMAYADYNDLMNITEILVSGLVKSIHGSYKIKYHPSGPGGDEAEIDFTPPFARVPVIPTLESLLNVTFPPANELHTTPNRMFLNNLCIKHIGQDDCPLPISSAMLLERLIARLIQRKTFKPTFLTNYPKMMSPLAKYHRDFPGLTERFELYIMTKEVSNAYTEQNDPVEQRKQFAIQDIFREAGDFEIPPTDTDYIRALEYGLPPSAGFGLGIDRLTMFLTDHTNIKDVLLFPATAPRS